MRPLEAFAALLVGLALSACGGPPESVVALSEPGKTTYDERLLGDWYYMEEDDGGWQIHIGRSADKDVLDVVGTFVIWDDANPVRWIRATAHASEVDGRIYYNVKRLAGVGDDYTAGGPPGFIILRAQPGDDGSLSLQFMDDGLLKNLVKEGRLKARRVNGRYKDIDVPYLMLDVSRPDLIALIREFPPEKLFGDPGRFQRLEPALK